MNRIPILSAICVIFALLGAGASQARADSWDWRDVDGKNFMTPAKAQGPDECRQFAGIACMEARVKIALNNPDYEIDLSEECIAVRRPGMSGYVLAWMTGVATEADWPYNPNGNPYAGAPGWEDRAFSMDGYSTLWLYSDEAQRAQIQNLIKTYGPLFTQDYHGSTIVGYDDDAQHWIVKETYGEDWGDNGYAYYQYGYLDPSAEYGRFVQYMTGDVYLAGVLLTDTVGELYTLTVTSGSGSDSYSLAYTAQITADPAQTGLVFYQWVGDTAMVHNIYSPDTTVMMTADATLTASYGEGYSLTVVSGSGSGEYTTGRVVMITADRPEGFVFSQWIGDTGEIEDIADARTGITITADTTITATYEVLMYTLTVNSGGGSGQYFPDQAATISADPAPIDTVFAQWTGDTAGVDDIYSPNTSVTMTSETTLTATYGTACVLMVVSGSGGGIYTIGREIDISAPLLQDRRFFKWTGDTEQVTDINSADTTITLLGNATVRAIYYLAGDCDESGTVNVIDINYVLRDWGKSAGIPTPGGDVNGDGVVDIIDLNMVLIDWGKSVP